MAVAEGSVSQIFVNPTYCCVTINTISGGSETVLLWSYDAQSDSATNRLLHANYLAVTRDAYVHNKTLRVTHPTDSALVDSVMIKT